MKAMSAWPGKFVIGLTGNIATGKSVVRRMLEHLGAYGIDADQLSHRAIAKGAPGYSQVLSYFGQWILGSDGQIDRQRLGRVAFADPNAMAQLEAIIHPLVRQAIDVLIRRAGQEVIVLEAIKLLEGSLRPSCDSIWVTHCSEEVQLRRLINRRNMAVEEAEARIRSQGLQSEKLAAADVIIDNNVSFEATWNQVLAAYETLGLTIRRILPEEPRAAGGGLSVQRAGSADAGQIAALVNRLSGSPRKMTRAAVLETFGEKAFLLLRQAGRLVGVAGWQVENLVARTTDVYLEKNLSLVEAAAAILETIESASRELQSEASLLFLPKSIAGQSEVWKNLGYEKCSIEALQVRAWQEAARETGLDGVEMLFKQLRADRVLRPI